MRDMIAEILTTAGRNKLRTALTGFSVAWGIFIIIFLLGAGNGLLNAVVQNSGQFLDNSMMVFSGFTSKPYDGLKEGRRIELNDNDIYTTRNNFTGNVETTGAEISQWGLNISFGDEYVSDNGLFGTYPNKAEINKINMLYGRFVNMTDIHERRKIIVLSEGQAKELAPHDISSLIGKTVDVGGFAFRVVGIYKDDNSRMNTDAYTAFTTLRTMYGRGDKADRIFFTFEGLETMEANEKFEARYRANINRNVIAVRVESGCAYAGNQLAFGGYTRGAVRTGGYFDHVGPCGNVRRARGGRNGTVALKAYGKAFARRNPYHVAPCGNVQRAAGAGNGAVVKQGNRKVAAHGRHVYVAPAGNGLAAGHFARKQGAAVRLNAYGGALVGRNEHYVGPVARPALAVLVVSAGNYRAVGSQANVMYAARSYHARAAERSARKGGARSLALAGVCTLLRLGRCVAHVYGKVNIPVILTASCKKRHRHYKRKQRSNDLFHALSSIRPAYAESYTYHII